jgi:hypothetical protein
VTEHWAAGGDPQENARSPDSLCCTHTVPAVVVKGEVRLQDNAGWAATSRQALQLSLIQAALLSRIADLAPPQTHSKQASNTRKSQTAA